MMVITSEPCMKISVLFINCLKEHQPFRKTVILQQTPINFSNGFYLCFLAFLYLLPILIRRFFCVCVLLYLNLIRHSLAS